MATRPGAALLALLFCAATAADLHAEDWIEVKSAHFTIVSSANQRSTRTLAWQLEQVRSAMATLWPWARVDLNKPLLVIAVRDENGMRAIAPKYWEERGGIRPASVWVTGPDRHYLAIRTDQDVDSQGRINPHISAYFSYINLVMGQSFSRDLPLWLTRGLSQVLSNMLIENDHIVLGAPVPWHLEALRELPRSSLSRLLSITPASPEFKREEGMEMFDAQAWAFVHFLWFGDNGSHMEKLNAFAKLVSDGKDAPAAFKQTLGTPESFEHAFRVYFERNVYPALRINIDVSIERERFPVRPLGIAESASTRAAFHVTMRRPKEARAAIADARKADPGAPGSYEAEGMLLDLERNADEARVALAKAVDGGSTSAYAHYRLASLLWRQDADRDTLTAIERHLAKATALNTRYAQAYSWLGEIRSRLGVGEPAIGLVVRAITLEPREAVHRLRAAGVLTRLQKHAEAEVHARAALALAETDDQRRIARELLDHIQKAKTGG